MKNTLLILIAVSLFSCQNEDNDDTKSTAINILTKSNSDVNSKNEIKFKELNHNIRKYVNAFVENHDFDGYILVQHKGHKVISESFTSGAIKFTDKTPFMIGSISKTFTAEIINSLKTKDLLKLSTHYTALIPEASISDKITIDQLLTHSSGIPDYYGINDFKKISNKEMIPKSFAKWISKYPLDFKPGKGNKYSNSGYNLLANLAETITQKSYSEILESEIFKPLKMTESGSLEVGKTNKIPKGFEPGNSPQFLRKPKSLHTSWLIGSGSIYASPKNLLIWSENIKKRLGDRLNNHSSWKPYGWGVRENDSEIYLEQNGRIPGYASNIRVFSESDLIIIVLSRIESDAVNAISQGISDILFNIQPKIPVLRKIEPVQLSSLLRYEGVYEITPSFYVTTAINNEGLGIATGTGSNLDFAALDPTGEDEFFFRVGYTKVKFQKNQDGEITGLFWGNNGPYPLVKK